ncbi:hypothetical protein FGG08_005743 [Glutinoglossum americanum]|uniref:Uncharacterized protein n=1 Tax=Glutinoglossum americanum TaxID=1670608 RepID=A0A9P8I317_9PEZI|nr:hypothetical protein FGG08_005743 [Glutinoglossum americanum]
MEFLKLLLPRSDEPQPAETDHKPYPSAFAILGGHPTVSIDVPVTLAFLALYIACGIAHISIHHLNSKRGHKFHLSGLTFDFCLARTLWAAKPNSVHIAITSEILVNAGTVMLFAINAMFSQRIIRAVHPKFGWNKYLRWFFIFFYSSIVIVVTMNITSLVTYHYTLNPKVMKQCRDIQLFGICWYTFLAIFPVPFVGIGCAIPSSAHVEKFGTGRFRSKALLVCLAAFVLTLGTGFRAVTAFFERPLDNPAWFHRRGSFYFFVFTVEIMVIIIYAIVRVDRRFHVPDGSKGPGDYGGPKMHEENIGSLDALMWDEEVFECPSCSHRSSMRTSLVLSRATRASSFNGSQLHITTTRPQSQSGPPAPASPLMQSHSPLGQEAPLIPMSQPMTQNDWDVPGISQADVQYPRPLVHPQHDDRIEYIPHQKSAP